MREAGIQTMASATNPDEAALIEAAGIDIVIAQGIEAGGHRGMFDTEAHDPGLSIAVLVSLLVRRTGLPVVAAGGIMDGRGIRAALELGAAGAQLGTAFILCPESAANEAYRAALRSDRAYDTRLTTAISGRPARGLTNRLILHGVAPGCPPACAYPLAYDAAKSSTRPLRAGGAMPPRRIGPGKVPPWLGKCRRPSSSPGSFRTFEGRETQVQRNVRSLTAHADTTQILSMS